MNSAEPVTEQNEETLQRNHEISIHTMTFSADEAKSFAELLQQQHEESPVEPQKPPTGLENFSEWSWIHVIGGLDLYYRHASKFYQIVRCAVGYLLCAFLCFNWVFSVIALATEHYTRNEKVFYIFTIVAFLTFSICKILNSLYRKHLNQALDLGEKNIFVLVFATTIALGCVSISEITETFGLIVFWSYAVTGLLVLLVGISQTTQKIYELLNDN